MKTRSAGTNLRTHLSLSACKAVFWLIVLGALFQRANAQAIFDALSFGSGIAPIGYSGLSPGWTFVPTADLHVVAVGCLAMQGTNQQISFWEGTNRILATYTVDLQSGQSGNVIYQSVDGPTLRAGAAYAVSAPNPQAGLPVRTYSSQATDGNATFRTSPFITGFGNFQVATNGQWAPSPSAVSNGDWLSFGATFRFEPLRQLSFAATATNLMLSWPTQSVAYAVQQNPGLDSTNWVTLTNAPDVSGSHNEVMIPQPKGAVFYRLISQ